MKKEEIINKVEQFFLQLKEQYGNIIYLENNPNISENNKSKELNYLNISEDTIAKSNVKVFKKTDNIPQIEIKTISSVSIENINFEVNIQGTILTDNPEWKQTTSLEALYEKIHNCTNCPLGLTRNKFVFGIGNPNADLIVVGEGPGADEDEQGLPFVGRAGQLLTKILQSINLSREDVYIANIIKCRPPNNRVPLPTEVEQCEPFLIKQIELIKPKLILALGLTAVDTLLKRKHKMAEIRGSLMNYQSIKMLVTYHPAALLRNPNFKRPVWEDMQLLRKLLDEEM